MRISKRGSRQSLGILLRRHWVAAAAEEKSGSESSVIPEEDGESKTNSGCSFKHVFG